MNKAPIRSATLEYISVSGDREVDKVTRGYDLICIVNGSCRYEDSRGEHEALRHSIHILTPGSRITQYRVGSSGMFEQVLISIDGDALFGRVDSHDREEERFEEAILHGLAANTSIEELAAMCCHSVSTFKRRFRERYSVSPHKWITERRLEVAQTALTTTNLRIKEVVEVCGYINTSHFISQFKRQYGITPARLRRSRHKAELEKRATQIEKRRR